VVDLTALVNINGEILEEGKAFVSIFDHGFLFGDSIYEVVRTEGGKLFFLDRHLARLHRSADQIVLELPCEDETIIGEIRRTVEAGGHDESYIRLMMSRGSGPLNIHPVGCDDPLMIIIVMKYEPFPAKYYAEGAKIHVASIKRNPRSATNPDIKSGNYLNNVLAIMEARKHDALEAVMLNLDDELTECTTSNLFLVHGEKVRTPALESGLLQGITREILLDIGPGNGFNISEARLTRSDLDGADEVFLSSTLKNVMPVTRIDERVVGGGKPGRVTMELAEVFRAFIHKSVGAAE
jgi:branched-chain amino acid aminotransferase